MSLFKNLYQYRELLKTNVQKEIRGKYKGSFLGILWSFVNPLLMVLVYSLVFSFVIRMEDERSYVLFLIVAIIPWNFFTSCLTSGTNCIWINGGIIKKVFFPREVLPVSVVTAGLINFCISLIIVFLFLLFGGIGFSIQILWLPFLAILQYLFTLGLMFLFSSINVYVRDVEYIVNFVVTLLFYGTPILYKTTMFPESVRWILYLNPMTHFIESYRNILYYQVAPHFSSIIYMIGVVIISFVLGYTVFRKLEKGFAEEV